MKTQPTHTPTPKGETNMKNRSQHTPLNECTCALCAADCVYHTKFANLRLEMPLELSNHPVSNEKVVLQDNDGMRMAIFDLESEAAYIVRVVNAHEELMAIAKDALAINYEYDAKQGFRSKQTKRLQEAIAKAEARS